MILCVDQDNLQPAIRDLRTAAGERPSGMAKRYTEDVGVWRAYLSIFNR